MSYAYSTLLSSWSPQIIVFTSTDDMETITAANYIGNDWNTFLQEGDWVIIQYPTNKLGFFIVHFDSGDIYLKNNLNLSVNGIDEFLTATNGITAHAGGGQANATQLSSEINRVITVATIFDSVKLPSAIAGKRCIVINSAALNACNIYPKSGESINALSTNTAIPLTVGIKLTFDCAVDGTWNT